MILQILQWELLFKILHRKNLSIDAFFFFRFTKKSHVCLFPLHRAPTIWWPPTLVKQTLLRCSVVSGCFLRAKHVRANSLWAFWGWRNRDPSKGCWWILTIGGSKGHELNHLVLGIRNILQGGPLPFINEVINPYRWPNINGNGNLMSSRCWKKARPEDIPALDDAAYESVLSTDWHPFYDARGVSWLEG